MEAEVILYGVLAGLATLLGSFFILKNKKFAKTHIAGLMSFAVGVLLGASFLELIPESIELNQNALIYV
ncbi:hypothetical protein HYT58_00215 [Candidatus Woesearchaeota archaeon]|nr:hypothetical protein [Candidatus Woesearchaeota archaeon]